MLFNKILVFSLPIILFFSGCLESVDDQSSNEFWGEDCSGTPKEICEYGPAPDFELVDQNGNVVNMSQFQGKVVLITFVYTYCPDICPAVTYQMKKLANELGEDYNESVVFLSVTVDPERDTPERLSTFANNYNASWQFLTSTAESSVGYMSPIWQDYNILVNIDDDACGGNGHYMEGYEGCHCNPGYVQDDWNIDSCVVDPDFDTNTTFEDGSLESQILASLDLWSSGSFNSSEMMNGAIRFGQEIPGIPDIISQHVSLDGEPIEWGFQDTNNTVYNQSNQNLTLIEFFHSNCGHCNSQIPALKEFHTNHSSNVSIISVGGYNLGGNIDNMSTIQEFAIEHNASWTYLYDDSNQMMRNFGLSSYPSWVLLDGDQIVARATGTKTYAGLEQLIEQRTEKLNISTQLEIILDNITHWEMDHISDKQMVELIAHALNYDIEDDSQPLLDYGISHSTKLYIIDRSGTVRVVWRGTDWTYASVYHDVKLLL